MANPQKNPDPTIRGGLVNVPDLTSPTHPPRHQPDTPRIKKETTTRSDHIPAATDITTKRPRGRPPKNSTTPQPTTPDEPTTDEPEPQLPEVTKNGTTPPS